MARNRNREFSEGNGLQPKDLGAYGRDTEERLPAWAQEMGEDADGQEPYSAWRRPSRREKQQAQEAPDDISVPLPETPDKLPEAPDPDAPLKSELAPEEESSQKTTPEEAQPAEEAVVAVNNHIREVIT